jgi:hypothetical protein
LSWIHAPAPCPFVAHSFVESPGYPSAIPSTAFCASWPTRCDDAWTVASAAGPQGTATADTEYTSPSGSVKFTIYQDNPTNGMTITFTTIQGEALQTTTGDSGYGDGLLKVVPGYKGQGYEISGFGWFQGHKELGSSKQDYESNLVNLINDLRKEFTAPGVYCATTAAGSVVSSQPKTTSLLPVVDWWTSTASTLSPVCRLLAGIVNYQHELKKVQTAELR